MKTIPNLDEFHGTTQYHYLNFLKNLKFTDGWVYLYEKVGCGWLADIIASVQNIPKIQEHKNFIIWRIEVKDSKGIISAYWDCEEKGNYSVKKQLYTQKVDYTDFPEGTFEWYQCNGVVMLKGEY